MGKKRIVVSPIFFAQDKVLPLFVSVGLIGLVNHIHTPIAGAQEDEILQLETFLAPAPQPQSQPVRSVQPLRPAVQPAPFSPSPPNPSQVSPQLSMPSSSPSSVLSLNSHRPGTLGRPSQWNEGFYLDTYQFEGNSGVPIMLNAIGSSDARMQLDPVLKLIGPNGTIVAEDDNSGYNAARGDARIHLVLPDTGTYTIVVTTATPDDRGRYSIGLVEVEDTTQVQ